MSGYEIGRGRVVALAVRVGSPIQWRDLKTGRKRSRPLNDLRISIAESCYGKNLGTLRARTVHELDDWLERAVDCREGKLGDALRRAQYALYKGNEARAELLRVLGLKRRYPEKEAALIAETRAQFAEARRYQQIYEDQHGTK
jgi:hypothetical protein